MANIQTIKNAVINGRERAMNIIKKFGDEFNFPENRKALHFIVNQMPAEQRKQVYRDNKEMFDKFGIKPGG